MVGVRSMGADARDDSNSLFFGGQVPEAGVRGGQMSCICLVRAVC